MGLRHVSVLRPGTIAECMRRCFVHVTASDAVPAVRRLMEFARIRHVLVLEEGWLVGIVSRRDLADETVDGDASSEPIASVMHRFVHTVSPEQPLTDAAEDMLRYRVGCLPVVIEEEGGKRVVGLLCESDLLAAAYGLIASGDTDLMGGNLDVLATSCLAPIDAAAVGACRERVV
jgi:acetoin utilization protein AcuB